MTALVRVVIVSVLFAALVLIGNLIDVAASAAKPTGIGQMSGASPGTWQTTYGQYPFGCCGRTYKHHALQHVGNAQGGVK